MAYLIFCINSLLFLEMGCPDTGRICLGASCKIWNRFYTYTWTLLVSKSKLNAALKLYKQIESIFDLIGALELERFKLRLPVTDQKSVKIGSLF